jgi:hypothetical protein
VAFKKFQSETSVPDSPEILFRDLPRRKIPDVMPNQREIMKAYAEQGLDKQDVAMQLPTGSGKTLVGLLIGEWRKRKFQERVVYFCPTRQLVNQVVEQAEEKYGLTVNGFVGSISQWEPGKKAEYRNADRLAVTTYSHLFNTNPFFCDADILIFDDAHVAENYVASLWTLKIERNKPEHSNLHSALRNLLKRKIDSLSFARLSGQLETIADSTWVDKIPTPEILDIKDELVEILDTHVKDIGLGYSWSMIQDHLEACHVYLSPSEILIRPLIPPTWMHEPFNNPKQRIYMSATLGEGGDLERLMGRRSIHRLPIPEGWDRQGVGRRFFIFPSMSLKEEDEKELRKNLIEIAGRALILVPSNNLKNEIEEEIKDALGVETFGANDIELSKKPFIETKSSVAIIANRYDGIDFPGDECRLLFIQGHPKAMNVQERFLMSRMGAAVLFNERIQTRILQAIGRCTRSLEDFSAVVVSGEEVPEYLADIKRRKFYHPELQAEIYFGVEQSKNNSIDDFKDNFSVFLKNGAEWEEVNQEIVIQRKKAVQKPFPALGSLSSAVSYEIDYQKMLWQGDFEGALQSAEKVLAQLTDPELKGYRALWHYLAGSAALLGAKAGIKNYDAKARLQFTEAKNASTAIYWLVSLSRYQTAEPVISEGNPGLMAQVERIERNLEKLGTIHERNFAKREKEILDGLNSKETFENAHKMLGEFLGFFAGKVETDGAPDPWWFDGERCFVFEDHAGAEKTSALNVTKARQATTHPNWVREYVDEASNADILPIVITPVEKVKKSAKVHLKNVAVWPLQEFRDWAVDAISTIRQLRSTFHEGGDLEWRANAADLIQEKGLDAKNLFTKLKGYNVDSKLTTVE